MPDETQQDAAAQEQQQTQPDEGQRQDEAPSVVDLQAQLKSLQNELRHAKSQNTTQGKRLSELEDEAKKRTDAEKTDLERAQGRVTELERQIELGKTQAQERAIKAEIRAVAAALGFNDPDDAYRADVLAAVEFGEDGEVKGAKEAIAKLAQEKPYLVGRPRTALPTADAGVGNQPASGGEVLTRGEQMVVSAAQAMGYTIDPKKVAQRKAQARVVTGRPGQEE